MQTQITTTTPIPGQYWNWRGHNIYYVRAGEPHPQRPPLLLVHGFGASTDHWRKNIAPLSNEFGVWAIDLLGFGRAAKAKTIYSGDLWRDQLHDFITEVIGQPTILVGNSLGGYASLCVAAQRPDRAAGLVLLNSAGPFTETEDSAASRRQTNSPRKFLGQFSQSVFRQSWASFLLFQYLRRPALIRKTLQKVYLDQTAVTDQLV
ncbi:MAG: alpha/beta fold hydrolase, partial [Hormoscilla sp.]